MRQRRQETFSKALKLVAEWQPAYLRWLQQHLRCVVFSDALPGSAAFVPSIRVLLVDEDLVTRYAPENVAAHLVNQAVIVRLWGAGVSAPVLQSSRVMVKATSAMFSFVTEVPSASFLRSWAQQAVEMNENAQRLAAEQLVFDLERTDLLVQAGIPRRLANWFKTMRRRART